MGAGAEAVAVEFVPGLKMRAGAGSVLGGEGSYMLMSVRCARAADPGLHVRVPCTSRSHLFSAAESWSSAMACLPGTAARFEMRAYASLRECSSIPPFCATMLPLCSDSSLPLCHPLLYSLSLVRLSLPRFLSLWSPCHASRITRHSVHPFIHPTAPPPPRNPASPSSTRIPIPLHPHRMHRTVPYPIYIRPYNPPVIVSYTSHRADTARRIPPAAAPGGQCLRACRLCSLCDFGLPVL